MSTIHRSRHSRWGLGRRERAEANVNEEMLRERRVKLVEHFHRLNRPTFAGTEGPKEAEEFFNRAEKIFELLGCMPWEKVLLATYSLQREADAWWKATIDNDM